VHNVLVDSGLRSRVLSRKANLQAVLLLRLVQPASQLVFCKAWWLTDGSLIMSLHLHVACGGGSARLN
jgi:hypothetical protein